MWYLLLAGGRLHRTPGGLTSLARTSAAGPGGRLQLARFLAGIQRLEADRLRGRSVRQWLAGSELRPDAEAVVRALLRLTTYVPDVDEFGADVAAVQLRMSLRGVLYLHGGWSQLVEALARQVQVRSRTTVRAIGAVAGRVEVLTDGPSIVARTAVVAPGTPVAARALLPIPAVDHAALANTDMSVVAICGESRSRAGAPRIADQVSRRRTARAWANDGVRLVVYQGRSGQVGSSAWRRAHLWNGRSSSARHRRTRTWTWDGHAWTRAGGRDRSGRRAPGCPTGRGGTSSTSAAASRGRGTAWRGGDTTSPRSCRARPRTTRRGAR